MNFFKVIRKYIIIQLLLDALATVLISYVPIIQKQIFDDSIVNSNFNLLIKYLIIYVSLVVLNILVSYISNIVTFKGVVQADKYIKKNIFESLLLFNEREFKKIGIGEYISIMNNDSDTIICDYMQPKIDIIRNILAIIIYSFIITKYLNIRILITIIAFTIICVLGTTYTSKILGKYSNEYLVSLRKYIEKVRDYIEGQSLVNKNTVISFYDIHSKNLDDTVNRRYSYGKVKSMYISIYELLTNFLYFICFAISINMLIKNEITLGMAIATLGYVNSFLSPIQDIINDLNNINSCEKILKNYENIVLNKSRKKEISTKEIELKNVSFSYTNPILNNINYTFKNLNKYCIIGKSGCGKSTLLKILSNNIEPKSGNVNYVNMYDGKLLYYLEQHDHIFKDTFENNCTLFGAYDISLSNTFFDNLDLSLKNRLLNTEDCTELSGGEKQIVSFIRALCSNSDFILMDEPFSAMDYALKKEVLKYLSTLNKTIIFITHDINDKKYFDYVVEIKDGNIV